MTWHEQARDFHRSADGRFDIVTTPAAGAWVAYDTERPKRHECDTLDAAKLWCEQRVKSQEKVKA